MLSVSALLFAGLFILAGCSSDSDSDESTGTKYVGKGVLGQISGVVYNSVIAQPIKDVSVELGGKTTVKTDANGGFLFKDVEPGTYTVSFYKEGFQFRTKNVVVDPNAYYDDDPFMEVQALTDQLKAIEEWIKVQQAIPGYLAESGSESLFGDQQQALTWTYQGGVYIDGNGATVTVKKDANSQYKVEQIKLDYTYSKGIPLYITSLAPLTGAIKTDIKLFTKPRSEINSEKIDAAIDIDDDVEFWLLEPEFVNNPNDIIGWGLGTSTAGDGRQPEYDLTTPPPTSFQEAKGGAIYGPAKTKNGVLSFTGLPVDIPLTLVSNGFVKKDTSYFYKFNTTPYTYTYAPAGAAPILGSAQFTSANGTYNTTSHTWTIPSIFKAENNSVDNKVQNYSNVGTVYLFPEGTFAIINNTDTGSPAEPKKTTDKITLTFSEPIDQATFIARLVIPNVGTTAVTNAWAHGVAITAGVVLLAGEWDDSSTTVTLAPAEASAQTGGLRPIFPYARNGTASIGSLTVEGKAQSGAKILALNGAAATSIGGIPVFTEEAIKLLGTDINPTDIPASRVVVTASAIKLVFNKEVSPESRFWLGSTTSTYATGQQVQFTISATDRKNVFVWTDLLTTTGQNLRFSAYSATDPNDWAQSQTAGTTNTYEKPIVKRLVLDSINIYNDLQYVNDINLDSVRYPIESTIRPIILTFNDDIPFTSPNDIKDYVKVALSRGFVSAATDISGNSISLSKTVSGNTLTITPTVSLEYDTEYFLDVQISQFTDTYFRTRDLVNNTIAVTRLQTGVTNPPTNIVFRTAKNAAAQKVRARFDANSATSTKLTGTDFEISGVTGGGYLRTGTEYYVQFNDPLTMSGVTGAGLQLVGPLPGDDIESDLTITLRVQAPDILIIRFNPTSGVSGEKTWNNVRLNTPIGAFFDATDPDLGKNGKINTEIGEFAIGTPLSGLTVRNYD
jgi:hypothetical protein